MNSRFAFNQFDQQIHTLLGSILVVIGSLYLLSTFVNIPISPYIWPYPIAVTGLCTLGYGMLDEKRGETSAIVGSIITMIALLLFVQTVTGFWASWVYVWILVAPTAVGIGLWLWGGRFNRDETWKSGRDLTIAGLILFAAFAIFFEGIIGIRGFGLAPFLWPILIIAIGIWLLIN